MQKMAITSKTDEISKLLTVNGCDLSKIQIEELICGLAAAPKPFKQQELLPLFFKDTSKIPNVLDGILESYLSELNYIETVELNTAEKKNRLNKLSLYLNHQGLSGFIIPRGDEHLNEYIPAHAERLKWLTGFTGSAGIAIVLEKSAALFVDGRYTIQAENEVPNSLYQKIDTSSQSHFSWLENNLCHGNVIGIDPKLHSIREFKKLTNICIRKGAELKTLNINPIDHLWHNQPPPPISAVVVHETQYAGETANKKLLQIGNSIKNIGAHASILTAPDSIAWLLNIRGNDVPNCPLTLCFAIIDEDGKIKLFIDSRKLSTDCIEYLNNISQLHEPEFLESSLCGYGKDGKIILVDEAITPQWFETVLKNAGGKIIYGDDPCLLPKSIKNSAELHGSRAAHLRDGAAVTRFLSWINVANKKNMIDELKAAEKLSQYRSKNDLYKGPSFDIISSTGSNAAIVHYRANKISNRLLQDGNLYLVDSGGQYLDGTTDVTRTIAIGKPTEEMRDRFTRVLKGHIALAKVRFPYGTSGYQLDVLARQNLWEIGLDYNHGTGHGVGSYLNVHEGPQRIGKFSANCVLEPGMIISNEPGYYKEGSFGIRIENLVAVIRCPKSISDGKDILTFETLTLVPIDKTLINIQVLTNIEIGWINAYHARVRDELGRILEDDKNTLRWLQNATEPL